MFEVRSSLPAADYSLCKKFADTQSTGYPLSAPYRSRNKSDRYDGARTRSPCMWNLSSPDTEQCFDSDAGGLSDGLGAQQIDR